MEQQTPDGLTVDEIDSAYRVLETLREKFSEKEMSNMSQIMNEAHYLVQQYENGARWVPAVDMPEVGDVMNDPDSNPKFGDGRVEIVEVTDKPASEVEIKDSNNIPAYSVAEMNPEHPADAPVVRATYVEGSCKVYAFPVTRLQEI